MDRCPACGARYAGKPACHRCGTDLARMAAVEADAGDRLERASAAFRAADYDAMYRHAKRSCDLRRTPSATATRAAAAVLTGRFSDALGQWSRLAGDRETDEAPQ